MDNKHEGIALNMIQYARNLDTAQLVKAVVEHTFDEALQGEGKRVADESMEAFENAKESFWQAFKYPLEVFDTDNGDEPITGEDIYVYDEYDGEWIRAELSLYEINGAFRFAVGNRILGSPNNYERYHRWVRLPKLEAK